jgi:hypothetical protein
MSENPITGDATNEAVGELPGEPVADVDTPGDGDQGDERGGGNREAAKYRTQLRATEAQRDALSDRLAGFQRGEAERLAAEHLADAADLWRDGLELAALLDDDGNLDGAKVAEHAAALRAAHPHWRRPPAPKRNPASTGDGFRSGSGVEHRPPVSWQSVLSTRNGGAD